MFRLRQKNDIGLKLVFRPEGETAVAEFTPGEPYQGWPAVVHGGIICTALDEAIGYAAGFQGLYAITTKLEVNYRKPAMLGRRMLISARVKQLNERDIEGEGEIRLEDGTLITEARAEMRIIKTA